MAIFQPTALGLAVLTKPVMASLNMMGRIMSLPVKVAGGGMEMLLRSTPQQSEQGPDSSVVAGTPPSDWPAVMASPPVSTPDTSYPNTYSTPAAGTPLITSKEQNYMPDQDLSDELLKTVHYEIKFKKRQYECTFGTSSETIHDNMTSTGYAGWKVAEFVQNLKETKMGSLPHKFREYLRTHGKLRSEDIKHFEVWFEVVDREAREDLRYHERHLELLEKIAERGCIMT